jgi:hypothetical protein
MYHKNTWMCRIHEGGSQWPTSTTKWCEQMTLSMHKSGKSLAAPTTSPLLMMLKDNLRSALWNFWWSGSCDRWRMFKKHNLSIKIAEKSPRQQFEGNMTWVQSKTCHSHQQSVRTSSPSSQTALMSWIHLLLTVGRDKYTTIRPKFQTHTVRVYRQRSWDATFSFISLMRPILTSMKTHEQNN